MDRLKIEKDQLIKEVVPKELVKDLVRAMIIMNRGQSSIAKNSGTEEEASMGRFKDIITRLEAWLFNYSSQEIEVVDEVKEVKVDEVPVKTVVKRRRRSRVTKEDKENQTQAQGA